MNGAAPAPWQPPPLTTRQIELIGELSLLDTKVRFGAMFEGAIYTLHQAANPEALPQAAHSLRELMEKLEGLKNIPITGKSIEDGAGNLGQKTRQLHEDWKRAKKESKCLQESKPADLIDEACRKLLCKIAVHFEWWEKNPKFLAKKAHGVVKGLDPLASMLPQDVQDAQAKEWKGLKDFFVEVSHHGRVTTPEAMFATVANLERFLYSRLAPVKAQNQSAIQQLISQVEKK